MKKLIVIVFTLCFIQYIHGQDIRSIRVNNAIKGQSWSYAINEIDSITYDVFDELQNIYVKGYCKSYLLQDVDSITFSEEEAINVVLSKDFIEGLDTYIFSNGIVVVEKEDSTKGKTIIVNSLNLENGIWSDDKSFAIYCDSLYNPIVAKDVHNIFYFDYDRNDKLVGISITDLNGNEVQQQKASLSRNLIRKVSTDGWKTEDGIGLALDIFGTSAAILNPTNGNIASAIASWFAKFLPEGIIQDIGALLPSLVEMLNGSKTGLIGSVLSYAKLIRDIGEYKAKCFIGDCTPRITTALQNGKNSVVLNVEISGVTSTSKDTPFYIVKYWQEVDGATNGICSTPPQVATNGNHTVTINNLTGGRYGFQVLIFPSFCIGHHNMINLYNFRSNIAYVDIARLYFKTIAQQYAYYEDDYVHVPMKVLIDFPSEQDKTILSYYKDYGFYVHYQQEEYYSAKENNSMEFTITLDIPREYFYFYKDFVAAYANKVIFKTYTIDGWGLKKYYDEKTPTIIYDKKPIAITKDVVSIEERSAIVRCQFEDWSFWRANCGVEYSTEDDMSSSNDNTNTKFISPQDEKVHEIQLKGLLPNTLYTYRAFCEVNEQREYGEKKTFTTGTELPDLSGTWNCKEYLNDRLTSEATFVLNADGTVKSSKDIFDNTYEGNWSTTKEGKLYIVFSYNDVNKREQKDYNGVIINSSRIEGSAKLEWFSYVNGRSGGNIYRFIMTR